MSRLSAEDRSRRQFGLITFDEKIRHSLPPRSKRAQLGNILAILSKLKPTGPTEIAKNLELDAPYR